ncbi:MAG: hypothetical protein KC912_03795 [Proteobacteria bacterium]|nr:hypothetical protein [Pseudomonadota bacterium]
MQTLNLTHIDSPLLAAFAIGIAVLGVAVLPWSDAEVRGSLGAFRALAALPGQLWRGLRAAPGPRVVAVSRRRALALHRSVRFERSL